MNKKTLSLGLIAISFATSGISADDPTTDPAAKRIPKFLDNGGVCVTEISYPAYEKAMKNNPLFKSGEIVLPDRVVERKVQNAGGEVAGDYEFASGNRQVDFFSGRINVVISDEIGEAAMVGHVGFAQTNLLESHFPELSWVRPEHFQGPVSLNRETYYLFADNGRELYVSPETGHPVQFRTSATVYEYSMLPQRIENVDVPPNVRAQAEQLRDRAN